MTRKGQLRLRDYIEHMLDAVIRNFEILGEAARNIESTAPEFTAAHAEIPWGAAYRLRNQVAHGYFDVDLKVVWQTIQRDLPGLKVQLTALLDTQD